MCNGLQIECIFNSHSPRKIDTYAVHPEKWLSVILSLVANKILNVNALIYLYFIGSHDDASMCQPEKRIKFCVFGLNLMEFEINTLYLQHFMFFQDRLHNFDREQKT